MSQEFLFGCEEELPMTFQVAMIGPDGWVLASDGRGTRQGQRTKRTTFETQKIRYDNQVASAPSGDEIAQIARDRIIEELSPDPTKLASSAFHRELERFAERIWEAESAVGIGKISPGRDRGIIFMAVGSSTILYLGIGKQSNISPSITTCVAGDPHNAGIYFIERYYEKQPVNQLAVLATHTVTQAARINTMVSGMHAMAWRHGETDAKWLDADDYSLRSQQLERDMLAVMTTAMADTSGKGT